MSEQPAYTSEGTIRFVEDRALSPTGLAGQVKPITYLDHPTLQEGLLLMQMEDKVHHSGETYVPIY